MKSLLHFMYCSSLASQPTSNDDALPSIRRNFYALVKVTDFCIILKGSNKIANLPMSIEIAIEAFHLAILSHFTPSANQHQVSWLLLTTIAARSFALNQLANSLLDIRFHNNCCCFVPSWLAFLTHRLGGP